MTRVDRAGSDVAARQPDVLALPSATTMRFVVLVVAMLTTGLFLGVTVFGAAQGGAFGRAVVLCLGAGPAAVGCITGERAYAAYALAGALVVALGAAVVVVVAPGVVVRLRRLRPLPPGLAPALARTAAVAADAGVRHLPEVLMGSFDLRDAFSFGRPGRYRVALPPPLAVRSGTAGFEAVMRHELAHIRGHDVVLAWLARSVWWVLAPLLLVPVAVLPLTGDGADLPHYLWRAAVLAVVVEAAARSALRSREHTADLDAARRMGTAAVVSVLSAIRRTAGTDRWQRFAAVHPSPMERVTVVERPGRAAAVTLTDGAVVSFLTLLTLPVLDAFCTAVFVGDSTGLDVVVAAVLVGTLAGTALGPGLWRQATVARVTDVPVSTAAFLGAVAGGGVTGQLVSPAGVGLDGLAGVAHPAVVLVTAGAVTAATAVTSGAGELWADAAGRVRSPRSYLTLALVVSIVVFATALWAGDVLQGLLDLDGWAAAGLSVFAMLTALPVTLTALGLAAIAGSALVLGRHGALAPPWLSAADALGPAPMRLSPTVVTGIAAGAGSTAVMVAYRRLIGESTGPDETLQRFYADLWMAGCAGAAAAVAIAVLYGRRGWGAGLLASAVAVLCAAAGHVGIVVALNGVVPLAVPLGVAANDLALGLLLTLAAAALVPTSTKPLPTRPMAVLLGTAVLLATVASTAVALSRDVLMPPGLGPVP